MAQANLAGRERELSSRGGGRSARTRPQRLARRRAETRGFDRGGGGGRSIFRNRWLLIGFGVVAIVALVGGLVATVGSGPTTNPNTPPPVRRTATEPVETGSVEGKPQFDAAPAMALEEGADYRATIELENGVVQIDLFEDIAPVHVNNFVFLAELGFYDDLTFHRIVPEFVAQAGDPTAIGTGGAGYTLPDEQLTDDTAAQLTLDARGVISMARSGLGASSSQFFITLAPAGFLDAQNFTAFGAVTSGMELLDAFEERDPTAQPPDPAGPTILSITIERAAPAANTEE